MAQCKSVEPQESGHFECNGFAARLKGKNLTIEVTGSKVCVAYDSSVFTHEEAERAVVAVETVNKIVGKSAMVKI